MALLKKSCSKKVKTNFATNSEMNQKVYYFYIPFIYYAIVNILPT